MFQRITGIQWEGFSCWWFKSCWKYYEIQNANVCFIFIFITQTCGDTTIRHDTSAVIVAWIWTFWEARSIQTFRNTNLTTTARVTRRTSTCWIHACTVVQTARVAVETARMKLTARTLVTKVTKTNSQFATTMTIATAWTKQTDITSWWVVPDNILSHWRTFKRGTIIRFPTGVTNTCSIEASSMATAVIRTHLNRTIWPSPWKITKATPVTDARTVTRAPDAQL